MKNSHLVKFVENNALGMVNGAFRSYEDSYHTFFFFAVGKIYLEGLFAVQFSSPADI